MKTKIITRNNAIKGKTLFYYYWNDVRKKFGIFDFEDEREIYIVVQSCKLSESQFKECCNKIMAYTDKPSLSEILGKIDKKRVNNDTLWR